MDELAKKIESWLKQQMISRKAGGLVVGLSGGVDSAVTAALCKKACPDGTLGLIMPCHSDPRDREHALLVAEKIGLEYRTIELDDIFSQIVKMLTGESYIPGQRDLPVVNIKPRLRMLALYFHASRRRSLVVGTSNLCEMTVGYNTKYGDGGADLMPIANLVKGEVRELARYLGVPREIIEKPPSAGLWYGHDDEKELGITYDQLDDYLLTGKTDDGVKEIIDNLAALNLHKKQLPAMPPQY